MSSQVIAGTIVVGILVAEIYAWLPRIAETLVASAANRLPESASQRYLDEWLAELGALPGGVAKVLFAVQVLVSVGSLLEELPPVSSQKPEESAPSSAPAAPALVLPKAVLPSASASVLQVAPQIRTLHAKDADLLDSFSTGAAAAWERDIAQTAQQLGRMLREDDLHSYEGRVAEAPDSQALVGVSLYSRRPFSDLNALDDAVYVALLGLNRPYRDARMPDDVTRVDSLLLADALAQIARKWGHRRMPYVWALAHRDHQEELALLTGHRFWPLKGTGVDANDPYHVLLRPDGCAWTEGFPPPIVKAVGTLAD